MYIKVWGARGSIPVSGYQYDKYGGNTTCVELKTKNGEAVILDAGTGIRALGNKYIEEKRSEYHLLFSHSHWDHLLGFPFFKPLYSNNSKLNIHGCILAQQSIKNILKETMKPPFFPVSLSDVGAELLFDEECLEHMSFAGLECHSIPLSHPNIGYGFKLFEGDKSLAFFPDNEFNFAHFGGKTRKEYIEFINNSDVLIHDSEYLQSEYDSYSRGWGHSVYLDTVKLAIEAEVKHLLMWHLNQDRLDDDVDRMLDSAREYAIKIGSDIKITMARQGLEIEL